VLASLAASFHFFLPIIHSDLAPALCSLQELGPYPTVQYSLENCAGLLTEINGIHQPQPRSFTFTKKYISLHIQWVKRKKKSKKKKKKKSQPVHRW